MKNTTIAILFVLSCNPSDSSSRRDLSFRDMDKRETDSVDLGIESHPRIAIETDDDRILRIIETHRTNPGDFQFVNRIAVANRKITYSHIKKNPARYAGMPWRVSGKIVELHEDGNGSNGRIAVGGDYEQLLIFVYPKQTDFTEGHNVDMLGILGGPYTYRSQAGWDITLPTFEPIAIATHGFMDKLIKGR